MKKFIQFDNILSKMLANSSPIIPESIFIQQNQRFKIYFRGIESAHEFEIGLWNPGSGSCL
jgi:hypothetical protein